MMNCSMTLFWASFLFTYKDVLFRIVNACITYLTLGLLEATNSHSRAHTNWDHFFYSTTKFYWTVSRCGFLKNCAMMAALFLLGHLLQMIQLESSFFLASGDAKNCSSPDAVHKVRQQIIEHIDLWLSQCPATGRSYMWLIWWPRFLYVRSVYWLILTSCITFSTDV